MGETNVLPAGQNYGGEWWQQLLTYGVGRAVDYEYLQPFALSNEQMYGRGADGTVYKAGQKPSLVPGMSNGVLLLGAGAVLITMLLLLKD